MSYYILPKIIYNDEIIDLIDARFSNDVDIYINKTLSKYLNKIKGEIDQCLPDWDKYKKYTNSYEYIHSVLPKQKYSICKLKPLSRSFYKLIEICKLLSIFNNISKISCKTYHLAEGPGGFIEASKYLRNNNEYDTYYGLSLIDDNASIPGWKKSKHFLDNNSNVEIETGVDKKGDLMNPDNLMDCYTRHNSQMDLITADGGFDFSVDFNKQENISGKLILSQIAFGIAMLKPTKDFIIKFFDTFTKLSIELLYILSIMFVEVILIKPNTSRSANSEKYVVCKNFRVNENDRHKLITKFHNILYQFQTNQDQMLSRILNFTIPHYYLNKIEEFNAIYGQQQIENIISTLTLINCHDDETLDKIIKNNSLKCIKWCQKYEMPFNKVYFFDNV